MPLSPKRVIHRKVQRGREKGNATRDNNIDFGEIALVAMEPTWLDARVIEAARVAINRKLDRKGNVWIRIFPDKPITKKPAEVRMGKGKGAPDHWAAVIKPQRLLTSQHATRRNKMADSKKKNDKELSYKELVAKRDELKKEYMDLRFKMVISHVDNPMQKRTLRREIARINTFIRAKELAGENK